MFVLHFSALRHALIIALLLVLLGASYRALPAQAHPDDARPAPLAANYPVDPAADFNWNAGLASVADIQSAFNQARANENSALPALSLPSQAQWNALSDGAKTAWLVNRERADRGVMQLTGVEANVTAVAQSYAQYLFSHNAFAHDADGHDPWYRLNANPAIGSCHDFLNVSENLSVFATTADSIPLGIEQAIYGWLYVDSGSSWGHRHMALWHPYNNNSGPTGTEGFLGIGRATGGPYQGPFDHPWHYAEITVMDVFDPCATWNYNPLFSLFLPFVKR